MGYWRYSSSPYDVQANSGGRFTFDTIKERYENTTPLRGKRKAQNIRPIGRRDRAWERMIKVSDNEYYVTYDFYQHRTNHNKAITFKADDTMEYLTIHTPRKTWTVEQELCPRQFSSASVFWFYDFNMPHEFTMVNHRANKYVRYDNRFYTVEKGDITFQRKRGGSEAEWQPLVVHREFKHIIDRKKAKELRQMIKPFIEYYNVMSDIVETQYSYGNIINRTLHNGAHGVVLPEQALELFKQSDQPHEKWLGLTEYLKNKTRIHYSNVNFDKESASKYLLKDLFEVAKPCKETEVAIGSLSNDRYKRWFA